MAFSAPWGQQTHKHHLASVLQRKSTCAQICTHRKCLAVFPAERLVHTRAAGNIVDGHVATSPPSTSSTPVAAEDAAPVVWSGAAGGLSDPATTSRTGGLESLDDMAAFVERTRVEEENIRRKREEVELQLLRMRQQEAVRQQQAIKLKLATDRANQAVLREQVNTQPQQQAGSDAGVAVPGDAADGSDRTAPAGTASDAGPLGVSAAGGPPKKKLMLKKSKRMTAVAAAAGLHRVGNPTAPPSTAPAIRPGAAPAPVGVPYGPAGPAPGGNGSGNGSGNGNGVPKALLSREELIEKRKESANAASVSGTSGDEGECEFDEVVVPKPIFIISDCTGESAARTVRAALNQFEARCRTQAPAQIMIFRFVESVDKMMGIIQEAAKEDALVVYTLVDPKSVKAVQTACKLLNVRYVDLWTALLDTMEVHLNAVRSGVPASFAEARKPKASLTEEYFRMIEAVEYTRKMDDGAHPQEWASADLVILGVSRCGKTPLSIYLGQRGYKVANLPLIPGCPVPKELFKIDQTRIVGLIIDPNVLSTIRRNRVNIMGVSRAQSIDYAEIKKINGELEWARQLYNANPDWPVLDVTLRGIEETAARILKMLNDRRGDASPKWVEAIHAKHSPPASSGLSEAAPGQLGPVAAAAGSDPRGNVPEPATDPAARYIVPEMMFGANESTFLMEGLY